MSSPELSASLYNRYVQRMQKIADVKYAGAVLQWDQETYLPVRGSEGRGRQVATLSEMAHDLFVADETGALLHELQSINGLNERQARNVELSLEEYNKNKKFSSAFVREMSETISLSYHAWIKARQDNDFKTFEPLLQKIVALKKQEAELLGYTEHPYNALLHEYERGATVRQLDAVFEGIKQPLIDLLNELVQRPQPDDSFLQQHFPKDKQWAWGQQLAGVLGFDFEAGRQDISEHPFTTNFNAFDVRITTRIDEHDFANMTWSTIHEVGHALYEQGLSNDFYGLPVGEYASLGIHESQSRLWENCIGRARPFWTFYFPVLKKLFPQQFASINTDQFVAAINKVQPSLIRTEADELTYHFHVMIRYELEKNLIAGNLEVKDIPAYWNEQYRTVLGVKVPDDKSGCLQDVHWSHGSFGYFPTYSLGSFYAAQFWEQAQLDMPSLQQQIEERGDTSQLLQWLRQKVHIHGKLFDSEALCKHITGKGLDSSIFMKYLRTKMYSL